MPTRTIDLHRLARKEVRKAVRWYRTRSAWAANNLLSELDSAVGAIGASADSYPVAIRNVRWCRLKSFNYIVYFRIIDAARCEVVALAHGSRRPYYWLSRLYRP